MVYYSPLLLLIHSASIYFLSVFPVAGAVPGTGDINVSTEVLPSWHSYCPCGKRSNKNFGFCLLTLFDVISVLIFDNFDTHRDDPPDIVLSVSCFRDHRPCHEFNALTIPRVFPVILLSPIGIPSIFSARNGNLLILHFAFSPSLSMSSLLVISVRLGYVVLLLLLLLSRFSRVRLCVTPETAAHQALPSLGFSRQEHWSGLPCPSPMHGVKSESEVAQSCPTLLDPMDCSPPGSSVHGIFQARALEWGAIAFSDVEL